MVLLPGAMPVTKPSPSTSAIVMLLLLHTPPAILFARGVVPSLHTCPLPVMAGGNAFTDNEMVA
jgi:hypothetical protein